MKEFFDYIKQDRQWAVLVGYILMITNLYFGYGFAILTFQQMGIDNAYVNGILVCVADLTGFLIVFFLIEKFSRRAFHAFHIFGIILCSVLLYLIGIMCDKNNANVKVINTLLSSKINVQSPSKC